MLPPPSKKVAIMEILMGHTALLGKPLVWLQLQGPKRVCWVGVQGGSFTVSRGTRNWWVPDPH